jgi:hypothetical protein
MRTAGLKTKLEDMEPRLAEVDAKLSTPAPSPVWLHPQLSELYRQKVGELAKTLADPEIRPMALETIRGLISSVTIHETEGGVRVELEGAITALVGLAQPEAEAFINSGSVKVVAGARHAFCLPTSARSIPLDRNSTPKIRTCCSREGDLDKIVPRMS